MSWITTQYLKEPSGISIVQSFKKKCFPSLYAVLNEVPNSAISLYSLYKKAVLVLVLGYEILSQTGNLIFLYSNISIGSTNMEIPGGDKKDELLQSLLQEHIYSHWIWEMMHGACYKEHIYNLANNSEVLAKKILHQSKMQYKNREAVSDVTWEILSSIHGSEISRSSVNYTILPLPSHKKKKHHSQDVKKEKEALRVQCFFLLHEFTGSKSCTVEEILNQYSEAIKILKSRNRLKRAQILESERVLALDLWDIIENYDYPLLPELEVSEYASIFHNKAKKMLASRKDEFKAYLELSMFEGVWEAAHLLEELTNRTYVSKTPFYNIIRPGDTTTMIIMDEDCTVVEKYFKKLLLDLKEEEMVWSGHSVFQKKRLSEVRGSLENELKLLPVKWKCMRDIFHASEKILFFYETEVFEMLDKIKVKVQESKKAEEHQEARLEERKKRRSRKRKRFPTLKKVNLNFNPLLKM